MFILVIFDCLFDNKLGVIYLYLKFYHLFTGPKSFEDLSLNFRIFLRSQKYLFYSVEIKLLHIKLQVLNHELPWIE